jgi:Mycobacterium membrane protein
MKRDSARIALRRGWLPLVAVTVLAVAGFCVYRLHGTFGSHHTTSAAGAINTEIIPFNPKKVVYEVFGPPDALATINFVDAKAAPQQVLGAHLPWSYTITTTDPAVFANVVAQGDATGIGCRIVVNGVVKEERIVNNFNAYTSCLDKSS